MTEDVATVLTKESHSDGGSFSTTDITAARQTLQSVYSPLQLRRFEANDPAAPLEVVFNSLRVGDSALAYLGFKNGGRVNCSVDYYHVDIVVDGLREVEITGRSTLLTKPGQAVVWSPRQAAVLSWPQRCAHLSMTVPEHRMHAELEQLLGRPVTAPVEFLPAMDMTRGPGRSWSETFRLVQRQWATNCALAHRVSTESLERLLIQGLLLAQPNSYSGALHAPEPQAPPPVVREAIDLMEAHPELPWTVVDLARQVCISVRSLQYGFKQSLGVSPSQYLREVRLHRVRADLKAADHSTATVAQVAARSGFHDLGRFAATYRSKFGESPSETLRS